MKRGAFILLASVLLGACMFFCTRFLLHRPPPQNRLPQEQGSLLPELEWLRHWLQLDEVQFAEVSRQHLAYRPLCQGLCRKVHELEETLQSELSKPEADLTLLLRQRADLQVECQLAMLTHVRQTAKAMNPEQARRYLDAMLPHALHLAPPSDSPPADNR